MGNVSLTRTRPGIGCALADVLGRSACSSCMNAFLLSCSLLDGDPGVSADVVMGPAPDGDVPRREMTIAFGNCRSDDRAYDIRIRGCPPYPFALRESLGRQDLAPRSPGKKPGP